MITLDYLNLCVDKQGSRKTRFCFMDQRTRVTFPSLGCPVKDNPFVSLTRRRKLQIELLS